MQFKNNTKRGNVTIQGLRSFKDTLPKNVKKIINKKGHMFKNTSLLSPHITGWSISLGKGGLQLIFFVFFCLEEKYTECSET